MTGWFQSSCVQFQDTRISREIVVSQSDVGGFVSTVFIAFVLLKFVFHSVLEYKHL